MKMPLFEPHADSRTGHSACEHRMTLATSPRSVARLIDKPKRRLSGEQAFAEWDDDAATYIANGNFVTDLDWPNVSAFHWEQPHNGAGFSKVRT
jgi:hypothetical protein